MKIATKMSLVTSGDTVYESVLTMQNDETGDNFLAKNIGSRV